MKTDAEMMDQETAKRTWEGYVRYQEILIEYARDEMGITPGEASVAMLMAARNISESHGVDVRGLFDRMMRMPLRCASGVRDDKSVN